MAFSISFILVLNLIINGLPSKLKALEGIQQGIKQLSFKPYYKWITF